MPKYCYYSDHGVRKHVFCAVNQHCCQSGCCDNDLEFYKHWYFWASIAGFTLLVVLVAISSYLTHKRLSPTAYAKLDEEKCKPDDSSRRTVAIVPASVVAPSCDGFSGAV